MELERIRNEHNKKVKRLIKEKVEFKKARGFKRQNSYIPQLDEFGDIDDADQLKRNFGKIRRSLDPVKKREVVNTVVKDVAQHRLEKDIMAQSVTDSLAGTNAFRKTGGRRGGADSQFKMRTGDSAFHGVAAAADASPGQVITTPDGQQLVVMPNG